MNEEKREKENLKKQKKIILIVIASLIAFAVIYFLIGLIDFDAIFNNPDENDKNNPSSVAIHFYDKSYSENPTEDEWYMNEAFKNITYVYGSGTVFSDEIQTAEDAKAKSESLLLLYNLVGYIKDGDSDNYNKCFSSFYFSNHERQKEFTKQKIYDIIITEFSTQTKSADGRSFTEYTFTLEYRIRHNNGSLRDDIGSGQSRKQYINISERTGAGLLIDDIYTLNETVIK